MARKKELSDTERIKRLSCLIEDEKKLKFNPTVIREHQRQLNELNESLAKEKVKRKQRRAKLKELKGGNK